VIEHFIEIKTPSGVAPYPADWLFLQKSDSVLCHCLVYCLPWQHKWPKARSFDYEISQSFTAPSKTELLQKCKNP